MPNVTNSEIAFLAELSDKIANIEGFEAEQNTLSTLLEKLNKASELNRTRTAKIVAEKRKNNPFYGRSKKEIEVKMEKLKRRKEYATHKEK